MEVNSSGYQASLSLQASYSSLRYQGELEIDGQTVQADLMVEQYTLDFQMEVSSFTGQTSTAQSVMADFSRIQEMMENIDSELIGYEGTPLDELTSDEASSLISEGGFFSVDVTAERVANFVLTGAGDDQEKLKAGRAGVLQGLQEAESLWGGKLPDIAYETMEKTLAIIDEALAQQGVPLLDSEA